MNDCAGDQMPESQGERRRTLAIHALERVASPVSRHRQCGVFRFRRNYIRPATSRRIIVWGTPLGLPDRLARPCFIDDLGYPDSVVSENLLAANLLNH